MKLDSDFLMVHYRTGGWGKPCERNTTRDTLILQLEAGKARPCSERSQGESYRNERKTKKDASQM